MNVASQLRAQGLGVETVGDILSDGDNAFRAAHVGASEVAALFPEVGGSPWVTEFELYHRKRGTIATPEFNAVDERNVPENERAYWGVKIEPIIVEAACERWGYKPLETPHRLSNGNGLGGHPDRIVTEEGRGKGVLEVKMVDWLQVKRWGDEPPIHYLLQNMTYQGLAGCVWGDMIVLVGGNELRRWQYEFKPTLYAEIEKRTEAFWQMVRAGKAPKPDYGRDGPTIIDLLGPDDGTAIDLRRDNRAGLLAAEYLDAKARADAADTEAEAAKAELVEKMGSASFAMLDGYSVTFKMVKGSTYTVTRKPTRRFNLKEKA